MIKPFRVIGLRVEDEEGLVYELEVQTAWHKGIVKGAKVYVNLSVDAAAISRALEDQAPIPPGFADDTAAQAWLDRYPVQT